MRVLPLRRLCARPKGRWRNFSVGNSSANNCWPSTKKFVRFVRWPRKGAAGRPRKKTAAAIHQEITREINLLLTRIFAERHQSGNMDLEAVELGLRASLHQAGATALTALLQFDPPSAGERQLPCLCGHTAKYVGLRCKSVLTAVGEAQCLRP